ncbi:hypothetical protein LCGC14_0441080 [marine sediment metagenome]|uniref:Uncharacterized protein n=1 Tax=marine sediment metagenome TaxID=412755 RepID=A0A0F9V797_9ZZZZ
MRRIMCWLGFGDDCGQPWYLCPVCGLARLFRGSEGER